MKNKLSQRNEETLTGEHANGSTINSVLEVAQPQYKPSCLSRAALRINPKWSWHYHTLIQLRDRLLNDRLEQISEVCQPLEPHSMHLADSATDELDHELAVEALDTEHDLLFEIEQAIRRILEGTYGKCQLTGKPIPAARLHAVPWTPFCKEVQAELEQLRSVEPALN